MRLPDFLIIGQMRAGTTALYSALNQHPDIYMPELKELRFFSAGTKRGSGLPRTVEEYAAHFDPAPLGSVTGEASPQYLEDVGSAERIHGLLRDVRLVATLRNPADRAHSLYLLEMRQAGDHVSFEAWYRGPEHSRIVDSVRSSEKLAAYYERFGDDRIRAVKFDRMIADVNCVAHELFEFLGVDPSFTVDETQIQRNSGGVPKSLWLSRLTVRFKGARTTKLLTKRLVPRSVWSFGKRMRAANYAPAEKLTSELRMELLDVFADDTRDLQKLTGIGLTDWLPR